MVRRQGCAARGLGPDVSPESTWVRTVGVERFLPEIKGARSMEQCNRARAPDSQIAMPAETSATVDSHDAADCSVTNRRPTH